MIYWAALGKFFKAASWSIAFLFFSKGSSKLFFWNELIANIYILILNITGYYLYGLTGLGVSIAVGYLLYVIQVFVVSKIKFDFNFDKAFFKIFIFQFGLAIASFIVIKYIPKPYPYWIGIVLIGISGWFSVRELDKRLGLITILKNI